MRHRNIGQVSLPMDVFVSSPEPALLRLPLEYTERMAAERQQKKSMQSDGFLGIC